MALDLADLETEVDSTVGVEASAELCIGELAKELVRLGSLPTVDPAVILALGQKLAARRATLGAAVAANPDPNPAD